MTTGLQVQDGPRSRRRRRLQAMAGENIQPSPRPRSTTGSSQDEYEESSSESDRVLSSSNEDIANQQSTSQPPDTAADEDDEDDTSTALGTGISNGVFTPQPNAFTHPPSSQTSRATSTSLPADSYFPLTSDRLPNNRTLTQRDIHRNSSSRSQRSTHTPFNVISPSHTYQPDHDAALRASLSTLLSCAAAARGLPKRDGTSRTTPRRLVGDAIDTSTLRMVPESALTGNSNSPPSLPSRHNGNTAASNSSNSGPSPPSSIKAPITKRKAAARETSKDRHAKKSRSSSKNTVGSNPLDEATLSPTLMTWVISAGVVVLFSAISFSAGFVWGRDIGRMEVGGGGLTAASDLNASGASCGQEYVRGVGGNLKRLRWSSAGSTSVRV